MRNTGGMNEEYRRNTDEEKGIQLRTFNNKIVGYRLVNTV